MPRSRRHAISLFALTGLFSILSLCYLGICQAGPVKPPATPSNLAATAVSYNQIKLTWKDTSWNEAGFSIERMVSGGSFTQIATIGSGNNSFQDTTVSARTTYTYRIRAYNSAGYSSYSNTASATTPISPPATPTNLAASAVSTSQIGLSWTNNATNASGFYIQRSTDNANFTLVGSTGSARTSYIDGGLTASTTYYYRVYAYNSSGNSAYSNVASTATLTNPPASPTGLTASAVTSSQINLSWTNNATNASGLYIQRSTDNVNFTQIASLSASATSYSDASLSAATTYYYRVDAYNSSGTSAWSNTASAATLPNSPAAPTGLTATAVSSSQINLSWTAGDASATGFYVQRSPDNVNFTQIASVTANATSYTDSGLNASTTYYYRVTAYNAGGASSYSNVANATTQAGTTTQAIVLPIEVFGATGTTQTVTFTLSSPGTALWMQIHGLEFPDAASVQVNGGAWIALDNSTVQLTVPDMGYGGIGGGFSTHRITLPVSNLQSGNNTLSFRFNGTDGRNMGFRVLAFNVLDANGNQFLPTSTFTQDDPSTWQPPLNDSTDIAAGQTLYQTATLQFSPLNSATMQAHCMDCHAQDGRDLKYFNYSNNSIIQRAIFHGLSLQQGQQIASYIRSLNVPNPGRPWNPPYQPGPGLDSQDSSTWAAGAGLNFVLDNDLQTLPYLFPNGITKQAIATNTTLNLRQLPIALPLPDWNHWLPSIHPIDAFGAAFVNSSFNYRYNGQGNNANNFGKTFYGYVLRQALATNPPNTTYITSRMEQDLYDWVENERGPFLASVTNNATNWTPALGEQVYSTGLWQLVKTWELMQEFNLEGYGPTLYGAYGEPRTWFTEIPFHTSPLRLGIPNNMLANSSLTVFTYLASAWYQLQLILDSANRHQNGNYPIDWTYLYDDVGKLNWQTGQSQAMRLTSVVVKSMQALDDGIGPEDPQHGWNPSGRAQVERMIDPDYESNWTGVSATTRAQILTALVGTWLDKNQQYTPSEYYTGGMASASYVPTSNYFSSNWADRLWYMIPQMRALGADGTLLNNVDGWAATLWPNANWTSL